MIATNLSSQFQELQKNQPSFLERLPTELRIRILGYISDYASLWSLISASPHYLKVFLGFRNSLLTRITIRELETRGVILCNQMTTPVVATNTMTTLVSVQKAHNIEWLDYKFRGDVEHTLTLQINLHAALQTYYSQIESNSPLCLDVQQLKALRTLEDVVTWLRFDSEVREYYSQISTSDGFEAVDDVSTWYVVLRESTHESYTDFNNLDVLQNYHPWIKGRRTESEIRAARIANAWFDREDDISEKKLDKLETFRRYFPWCDITTVSELTHYEDRIIDLRPTISFLFEDTEISQTLWFDQPK